jgi:hypothetical protein
MIEGRKLRESEIRKWENENGEDWNLIDGVIEAEKWWEEVKRNLDNEWELTRAKKRLNIFRKRKKEINEEKRKVRLKEKMEKTTVVLNREYQETITDQEINEHVIIPSTDPIVRKEAINKELEFIRKKWSEMEQEKLEKKLKL